MSALWTPSNPEQTEISKFRRHISSKYGLTLDTYEQLHAWSVEEYDQFWAELWDWTKVISSTSYTSIIDKSKAIDTIPAWFEGAKLNWAENMLRDKTSTSIALIEAYEPLKDEALAYTKMTYAELYREVQRATVALRASGLTPGKVVVFYGPTSIVSVVLLLATVSCGAIWSSSAADFGSDGVLERVSQLGESLWGIFGVESVRYNEKRLDQRSKLETVVKGLRESLSQPFAVTVIDYLREGSLSPLPEGWQTWDELMSRAGPVTDADIDFYQAPFDYPLWVLFSSGTTGKPKPIVHRAGGMLLQSLKEHILHGGMTSKDVFFYYTTPGWMMYNYLVAGLATGASLVLFDGSPLFRPNLLWDMTNDLGITVFGTSAKYLDVLSHCGYVPNQHHALKSVKQVLSTGSPLKPELFDWVYKNISSDVVLGSITGGTDICSLFGAHNEALPVYRGEIQCLGLGMAVDAYEDDPTHSLGPEGVVRGVPVARGASGELVCTKPFPCMPIFFWNDKEYARYKASYFERFSGVWAHGDYCVVTPSVAGNGGGLIMLGRSDGVLNPSGIRFGSSEIYEVMDTFAPAIVDTLVVGQKIQQGSDERVVLFVQLAKDQTLSEELVKDIKTRVRQKRSARHVPEKIIQVHDIPHTINGKKVEVPIKKILSGADVSIINPATLRNPECLAEYAEIGVALRKELKDAGRE